MSTKTKFNKIYCNHMFYSHSILKSTFPTPSTFPSYATECYNPKYTLMSVCCVCKDLASLSHIYLKLISVLMIICLLPTYINLCMDAQNVLQFHSNVLR